jgi:ArsR family transcriptional regulator
MALLPLRKALADPTRLRLIAILNRSECTVQELTAILGMGQSRISRHLKILVDVSVLAVKRQGTWGYYRTVFDDRLFAGIWPDVMESLAETADDQADRERLTTLLEARRRRSREFFDRHARRWDDLAEQFFPVADYRTALLEQVPVCQDLLEVGVGTGSLLPLLTVKAARIIGVDQSPGMLDEARSRVANDGIADRVELRLGEMTHLPLADASVDCALLNMVLHHAAEPGAVFLELARVLKVGGRLVIVDLRRHDQEWVRERMADQWLGFARTDLVPWLAAAGFIVEDYQEVNRLAERLGVFLLGARRNPNAVAAGVSGSPRKESNA